MKKIFLFLILCILFIPKIKAETEYAQNSKSAILMEASTGTILYEKNIHEKLSPASMTKIMTMLLAMEALEKGYIKLSDDVLISGNASGMGGTQIFIEQNTKVKFKDLLKGVGIASANDAAVAMAEHIGGTEENFVNMMNKKAKELGCLNTNFKNSHGLDEANHYSSAYDMAIMAKELVKHEEILKITSTYEEYININGKNHWLVNTNSLVRFYDGVDGIKTGFTDEAKYCLTATMKRNGMRLIAVSMGAPSKELRSTDVIKMMEYGYSMYNIKTLVSSNKKQGEIFINKSKYKKADYYLENDVNVVVDINTRELNYDIKKELYPSEAPLKKGDVIGKLILKYKGKKVEYNLIVKQDIEKANFIRSIYNNFKDIISGNVNVIR